MTVASRLLGRLARLPRALTHDVLVERNLRVPMPDGAVLLADRHAPRGIDTPDVVLIRTPYGRRSYMGVIARVLAERGYQVVVQSVRGTFGSGGVFDPFRHEAADGRTTLAWLEQQPWLRGGVAMTGASYLGFVQWAVAAGAPESLRALAVQVSASEFRSLVYPAESFSLDSALTWVHLVHHQERSLPRVLLATLRQRRALARVFTQLPLDDLDRLAVGGPVGYYQDWLEHAGPDDAFWREVDHSLRLGEVTVPVNLVGGWYDLFLPRQLADFHALREAGRNPHLLIGPWTHASFAVLGASLRESLSWFDAHLRGRADRLRAAPVRVMVMGSRLWRDLPDWPPPSSPTRWHLHGDGGLDTAPPAESAPDRYDYDPESPTPSLGGVVLGVHAGARDNRRLEARPDVLVYTGAPLDRDLEIMGSVSADLHVRSSSEHSDFFVRLCDVEPGGRSVNICDGLVRLRPGEPARAADGSVRICVDLWPTAHCFRRGHRVRVQVSSGAHPRFARNLCGGEPLGRARACTVAHQEVLHDPVHPSAIVLPHTDGAR